MLKKGPPTQLKFVANQDEKRVCMIFTLIWAPKFEFTKLMQIKKGCENNELYFARSLLLIYGIIKVVTLLMGEENLLKYDLIKIK